jgi:hypothetical protein
MRPLLFVGAALLLTSCAPAGTDMAAMSDRGDPSRCFRTSDVDNFRRADSETVFVRSRQGYGFQLTTPVNCTRPGVDRVSVEPYVASSPWICAGDQARLRIVERAATPQTCIARVSGPIADAVSQLPTRNNPGEDWRGPLRRSASCRLVDSLEHAHRVRRSKANRITGDLTCPSP